MYLWPLLTKTPCPEGRAKPVLEVGVGLYPSTLEAAPLPILNLPVRGSSRKKTRNLMSSIARALSKIA
jgi:hypothetical protein